MDIEPASETECRDRGLGGTLEDNREECFLETPMMSAANQTGDSSCPLWLRKVWRRSTVETRWLLFESRNTCEGSPFTRHLVQQELEDAEFIPMPEDCDLPTPDQLASFSESITSPYEELKELKAAAAAVGSRNGLSVMPQRPRFASVSA